MMAASFFAPRLDKWDCDYLELLRLVDASCRRFDVPHVVISDRSLPHLDTMICSLPDNLMEAILEGQRQCLAHAQGPVLLIGADCLVLKDPRPVLAGDMTVTIGPFHDCVMNTGAIWCADGPRCAPVWADALSRWPAHWGDDQTSLYAAVKASSLDVREVRCEDHNWAPADENDDAGRPTVVHFRGRRKAWMARWVDRFVPESGKGR